MGKPWFMYDITVPFGNPNYDSGYGGSHDMDLGAPPNAPVTNLLGGTVVSRTRPSWGCQVGIRLDSPYNGNAYAHFLHLSAINPDLTLYKRIPVGYLIGWVGGANDPRQYDGTSNPTGENFLNDPSQSSQVQVGFALSHGPEYGVGAGWEQFPPIDWSRDPTPIIEAARKTYMNQQQSFLDQADIDLLWDLVVATPKQTGIYHAYIADMLAGHWRGVPLHAEVKVTWRGVANVPLLQCSGGFYTWEGTGTAYWHPNS